MQTNLPANVLASDWGQEANTILRSCVHCGFCTATCPTYLLNNDELDGPRGRIYLIKDLLETAEVSPRFHQHIDRCLSCRSCETTCPSGVQYSRLVDLAKDYAATKKTQKTWPMHWAALLQSFMANQFLFATSLQIGQFFRPVLPNFLQKIIPRKQAKMAWSNKPAQKKVLILSACMQKTARPATNAAFAHILAGLDIEAVSSQGVSCCGALAYHGGQQQKGLQQAKQNIDLWCQQIDALGDDLLAISVVASGCGSFMHEYNTLFQHDKIYALKAQKIVDRIKDPAQILAGLDLKNVSIKDSGLDISFHAPCSLQHGLKTHQVTENLLRDIGFNLVPVDDAHLCCGSAGTYSLKQPAIAQQLRTNKITNLTANQAKIIATSNIGCEMHMQNHSPVPVVHWLDLLHEQLS